MKAHHIVRHSVDFLLLILIMVLGFGGLIYFKFDLASQVADIVLMAALYVFWGVYHHFHDGDLTAKVVMEYISIAALVSFILIIFLLRA